MLNKHSLVSFTLATALLCSQAHAFSMKGNIAGQTPINQNVRPANSALAMSTPTQMKTVYLMKVKMSKKEKQTFFETRQHTLALSTNANDKGLPSKVDDKLANMPVLDQGHHGTCATFANTALINALLEKPDYVSQLCLLELGSHVEQDSYLESGWDGTLGPAVLNRMMNHGVIEKSMQQNKGCAGVKEYPLTDEDNQGQPISLGDYHAMSTPINDAMFWEPLLSVTTRIFNQLDYSYDPDKILLDIKKSLANQGEDGRKIGLSFGVLLPLNYCSIGACGHYHVDNDTWAYTNAMRYSLGFNDYAGHEMVIAGYDDDAVVTDNEGATHKGVLILRNSWGKEAGDHGNYYMTYDFFKMFAIEVQKVTAIEMFETDDQ